MLFQDAKRFIYYRYVLKIIFFYSLVISIFGIFFFTVGVFVFLGSRHLDLLFWVYVICCMVQISSSIKDDRLILLLGIQVSWLLLLRLVLSLSTLLSCISFFFFSFCFGRTLSSISAGLIDIVYCVTILAALLACLYSSVMK